MFGKRISLAVCATLVGVTFVLGQAPPDRSTQGSGLQQQPGTTPSTPSVPTAPAAQQSPTLPGQTQTPAQPQGQTLPGQAQPGFQPTQAQPVPGQPLQPGQVQPQQSQGTTQQHQNQGQEGDDHFVVKAGEIDLAEINIGRLAQQRSSRQDIRQFANQLVQDHSQHLTMLNQVANRNNLRGAERMDQDHQQLFQKLASMQGQEFDREFIHKMVEGHKKAIGLYEHASQNCKNAELKNLATQTLATLRQHEQTARQLAGQGQPGQANQPTSSEQNDANRTDGAAQRNDQNRHDPNRDQPNRNDKNQPRPQDR